MSVCGCKRILILSLFLSPLLKAQSDEELGRQKDFLASVFWGSSIKDSWVRYYSKGEEMDLSQLPSLLNDWTKRKDIDTKKFRDELVANPERLQKNLEEILKSESLQSEKGEAPKMDVLTQLISAELNKLTLDAPVAKQSKEDAIEEEDKKAAPSENKVGSNVPTAKISERTPSSEVQNIKIPELVKDEKTTLSKTQVRPPKISPEEVSADEVTATSAENVPAN